MPNSRFSKFYWIIPKLENNQDKVEIAASDDGYSFWLLGSEQSWTLTWITTHFYLLELKVPNEINEPKITA